MAQARKDLWTQKKRPRGKNAWSGLVSWTRRQRRLQGQKRRYVCECVDFECSRNIPLFLCVVSRRCVSPTLHPYKTGGFSQLTNGWGFPPPVVPVVRKLAFPPWNLAAGSRFLHNFGKISGTYATFEENATSCEFRRLILRAFSLRSKHVAEQAIMPFCFCFYLCFFSQRAST